MLPGLNSNVSHDGVEYHVQTEDLGRQNPCILTLVFRAGAIIAREKVNYRDALGEGAPEARIKHFMDQQHHRVIQSLQAGQPRGDATSQPQAEAPASPPSPAPPLAPPPVEKNLDQLIAEYLRRRSASKPR
ncbi:MAG: hypothetical protein HY766_08430 [candidate division NC10 bacterium]|nr:hypothetical protein [candidate division NC10 bacterium]